MNHPSPRQQPADREYDEELALTFLSYYLALEQALVRAGFTRAGHTPGTAQADWARFARHIEAQFDPGSSPELEGSVAFLLADENNLERRNKRLEKSSPWENADANNDIVWISELVQQTGKMLAYGLNLPGRSGFDLSLVSAVFFIVQAWSHLDPQVESLLTYVH